jgi:sigma-B regulation protein RsbU (phosphoserine phosphatase)
MTTARTLIADDQPDVLEALRLLLKNEGFHTEAAQSPAAVLDKLRSDSFDLILMDLNYTRDTTSGNEGLDLLARIQAIDHTLPVVAMTAWASVDLAVEAMRRGVCDFVLKPWENSQLVQTLKSHVEKGRNKRHQLRQERERFEDAHAAGLALLPQSIPEIPGFEIAAASQAAQTLSGDYFDVLDLGEGKIALSIADVIGKGVPAALLMSNVQATVRALATPFTQPADLAARLNHSIRRNTTQGKFVTFFCGILDSRNGTLTYTNAGHCAPILVRSTGAVERLEVGGAVLGVFSKWSYEQTTVTLWPGDRLLLFTDGITEAENATHEEFGEDRLAKMAIRLRHDDAAGMKDQILRAVAQCADGSQQDDATLLVVACGAGNSARSRLSQPANHGLNARATGQALI